MFEECGNAAHAINKHSGQPELTASGVYIQSNTELAVGSSIEFDITLPAEVLGTPGDVEVRCTGRVVRKDGAIKGAKGKKQKNGVACVIDEYKFIRTSKGTK